MAQARLPLAGFAGFLGRLIIIVCWVIVSRFIRARVERGLGEGTLGAPRVGLVVIVLVLIFVVVVVVLDWRLLSRSFATKTWLRNLPVDRLLVGDVAERRARILDGQCLAFRFDSSLNEDESQPPMTRISRHISVFHKLTVSLRRPLKQAEVLVKSTATMRSLGTFGATCSLSGLGLTLLAAKVSILLLKCFSSIYILRVREMKGK